MQQVVPWAKWPSGDGKTVAVVRAAPRELEARFGLKFEQCSDDLDGYRLAAVEAGDIGQLWLWRYEHAPEGTTQVVVDSAVSESDALASLKQHFGAAASDLDWTATARKPVVLVLHGPAGVGKDSVIEELKKRKTVKRATSSTTRAPREGEVDGRDYHFLSWAEFEAGIEAGEFVEYARVYDDFKGVHASEVRRLIESGEDMIIRTDVQGARTWRRKLEGGVFIFLMAEDRETLRARLIGRGSETVDSMERRLAEIDEEIDDMPNNDYVVYNHHGQLDKAVAEVEAIMERERANPKRPVPRLRE